MSDSFVFPLPSNGGQTLLRPPYLFRNLSVLEHGQTPNHLRAPRAVSVSVNNLSSVAIKRNI